MKRRFMFLVPLAGLAGLGVVTDSRAAPSQSNSTFIASPAALQERMKRELHVTTPDFVVFVPTVTDTNVNDTGNEHFLVFDGPDGSLMAVWTQSSAETQPDQHNHDGHYQGYGPTDTGFHRRPVFLVPGRFQPGADQPVWFDEPKGFMDHTGASLGKPGTNGRLDLALYSSFTVRQGRAVLWYPERKFFLLGRVIAEKWFAAAPAGQDGSR